jgi:hypothetical protein
MRLSDFDPAEIVMGVIATVVAAVIVFVIVAIIQDAMIDRGQCLASHHEMVMVPQYTTVCTGKSCTMTLAYFLPVNELICDQWEFPNGRPKGASKP